MALDGKTEVDVNGAVWAAPHQSNRRRVHPCLHCGFFGAIPLGSIRLRCGGLPSNRMNIPQAKRSRRINVAFAFALDSRCAGIRACISRPTASTPSRICRPFWASHIDGRQYHQCVQIARRSISLRLLLRPWKVSPNMNLHQDFHRISRSGEPCLPCG